MRSFTAPRLFCERYGEISRAQSFKLELTVAWFIKRRFAYCERAVSASQFFISRVYCRRGNAGARENCSGKFIRTRVSVFQGSWCRTQELAVFRSGSRWPGRDCNTRKHPPRCAMFPWVITPRITRAIITSSPTTWVSSLSFFCLSFFFFFFVVLCFPEKSMYHSCSDFRSVGSSEFLNGESC